MQYILRESALDQLNKKTNRSISSSNSSNSSGISKTEAENIMIDIAHQYGFELVNMGGRSYDVYSQVSSDNMTGSWADQIFLTSKGIKEGAQNGNPIANLDNKEEIEEGLRKFFERLSKDFVTYKTLEKLNKYKSDIIQNIKPDGYHRLEITTPVLVFSVKLQENLEDSIKQISKLYDKLKYLGLDTQDKLKHYFSDKLDADFNSSEFEKFTEEYSIHSKEENGIYYIITMSTIDCFKFRISVKTYPHYHNFDFDCYATTEDGTDDDFDEFIKKIQSLKDSALKDIQTSTSNKEKVDDFFKKLAKKIKENHLTTTKETVNSKYYGSTLVSKGNIKLFNIKKFNTAKGEIVLYRSRNKNFEPTGSLKEDHTSVSSFTHYDADELPELLKFLFG